MAFGAGYDPDANTIDLRRPGASALYYARGEGGSGFFAERYTSDTSAPTNRFNKHRGTIASPSDVASGDNLGQFVFFGYAGGALRNGATVVFSTIAATPSSTDMQSRMVVSLSAAGSVTATEMLRADHASGLSMFGANPVIDQNRHHRLRSYTVATLPSASAAGQLIYVSDGTSNKRIAVSDGTNWRFPDGNIVS